MTSLQDSLVEEVSQDYLELQGNPDSPGNLAQGGNQVNADREGNRKWVRLAPWGQWVGEGKRGGTGSEVPPGHPERQGHKVNKDHVEILVLG